MNIFKVIASGKGGFHEVYASAILDWFLNPYMEHGMGFTFLIKFIEKIQHHNSEKYIELKNCLKNYLRSDSDEVLNYKNFLEKNTGNGYIDILIEINNWVLAIENKIFLHSVSEDQIKKYYEALRKRKEYNDKNIALIYLVPLSEEDEVLPPSIYNNFEEVQLENDFDLKLIYSWKQSAMNYPSISGIIQELLEDEIKGKIEPLSEYIRHTLKAFKNFIENDFSGYEYDRTKSSTGLNPLTEDVLKYKELMEYDKGWVGVKNEVAGLLRMDNKELENRKYQFTRENDMTNRRNWISLEIFIKIIKWKIDGELTDIKWEMTTSSDLLYEIAKDYKDEVYIGIKGGEKDLGRMSNDVIRDKRWQISRAKSSSNWIKGSTFVKYLNKVFEAEKGK